MFLGKLEVERGYGTSHYLYYVAEGFTFFLCWPVPNK